VEQNNKEEESLQVTWIGHATCLLQIGGYNVLTDPIFSKRCAPTQWAGPARYRPPPCSVSELVEHLDLDVVLVSHNHYDHLDYHSIRDLSKQSKNSIVFVVPLGIGQWLRSNISKIEDRHTIVELDWHETHSLLESSSTTKTKLDITAVPMQHWSSRRGWDRDSTLWCGFSVRTTCSNSNATKGALFPGDTGWFEGLYDIGKQYGPFDLAMIPIGAYEPRDFMKPQHTNPSDGVKMMQALQARRAVPIHWATFQLTREHYLEPREKLAEAVKEAGLPAESFGSWFIGETVTINKEKEKN
jgi:L-ascorbate metabolism protein UlaG (beta-lactamase superfamily)